MIEGTLPAICFQLPARHIVETLALKAPQVLASLSFLKGIQGGDLAQGAAVAIFFFPVLAGLAIMVLKLAKKAVVT